MASREIRTGENDDGFGDVLIKKTAERKGKTMIELSFADNEYYINIPSYQSSMLWHGGMFSSYLSGNLSEFALTFFNQELVKYIDNVISVLFHVGFTP